MAGPKDKFRLLTDLEPLETKAIEPRRRRGPMAEAVAETAESLDERQTERARLLEKMKSDQAAFQAAVDDERLDLVVDVTQIRTGLLERDRAALDPNTDDADMQELKASIATRGLQQSIKIIQDEDGGYQLESGWRRLTAYRQLLAETGDAKFQRIRAKVAPDLNDLDAAYGRMVDENMVRKGVSHGELAVLAVRYAKAGGTAASTVEAAVDTLFASAVRAKRYHLRQIAVLFEQIIDVLGDPSGVPRDVLLRVADLVQQKPASLAVLRDQLNATDGHPANVIAAFYAVLDETGARQSDAGVGKKRATRDGRKIEFRAGGYKCTVKGREVRLLAPDDLADVDEDRLHQALDAFRAAMGDA